MTDKTTIKAATPKAIPNIDTEDINDKNPSLEPVSLFFPPFLLALV